MISTFEQRRRIGQPISAGTAQVLTDSYADRNEALHRKLFVRPCGPVLDVR
jgi:hypothetical protein